MQKFNSKLKIRNLKFEIRNSKAFTLVELLVYMALLAIFIIVLTDILVSILDVRTESEATGAAEQDGRFIIARLSHDINQASTINIPTPTGSSGATLEIVIDGDNHTYTLSGNNLQLTNSLGTNNLNSSETGVVSLNFQRIGNALAKDTIRIDLTIESVTTRPSGPEVRTYQTTVGLR